MRLKNNCYAVKVAIFTLVFAAALVGSLAASKNATLAYSTCGTYLYGPNECYYSCVHVGGSPPYICDVYRYETLNQPFSFRYLDWPRSDPMYERANNCPSFCNLP
jgi:hypothetical protein